MGKVSCEEIYENVRSLPKENKKTATSHSCRLWWCLGTISFILVGSIVVNICIVMVLKKQEATISDLTNKNEHLNVEKAILKNQTEQLMQKTKVLQSQTKELKKDRDNFKWTLDVILTYNSFPVKELCPKKQCQPCPKDWIVLQEKCYLFYSESAPWKTWEESQEYCLNLYSDLVVIDSLHEQEFICNHTKFYYDKFHGYWMGLQHINNYWIWIDGHNDTLRFWMEGSNDVSYSYGLLIPERNPTGSWIPAKSSFLNKFICERKALIRSN